MKNLIIIGKNSDIANDAVEAMSSVYQSITRISINYEDSWDFPLERYDVIDFNVVASERTKGKYEQLISKLENKINAYVLISTKMHNKQNSAFLSSYRKFKIKQEFWLKKLIGNKLKVIHSPDVLDSRMWKSIKHSDGIYKLDSLWNKQVTLKGITKENLIKSIKNILCDQKVEIDYEVAYLICSNTRLTSITVKIKALLIFILSKSKLFSDFMSRRKEYKSENIEVKEGENLKFYGGGFADL
ncbi:hypothetical protein ACP6H4_14260 [Vibrio harveyi]|uniref:hypothetical protein n=1 Tax=Vibrio harveyi TaxID=669 RepID=UPI003CE91BF2